MQQRACPLAHDARGGHDLGAHLQVSRPEGSEENTDANVISENTDANVISENTDANVISEIADAREPDSHDSVEKGGGEGRDSGQDTHVVQDRIYPSKRFKMDKQKKTLAYQVQKFVNSQIRKPNMEKGSRSRRSKQAGESS